MIIKRKPLIYIPKRKKKGGDTTIINPTEVLGAVFIGTTWLNYNPIGVTLCQRPSKLFTGYETSTFSIRGKNLNFPLAGSSNVVWLVPIRGSGMTLAQRADAMRWAPIYTDALYHSPSHSLGYAFYVCSGSGTAYRDAVIRFKNSTYSSPYSLMGVDATGETYTTSPTYRSDGFSMSKLEYQGFHHSVSDIESALTANGVPTDGVLLLTDRDTSVWTDNVLIDFCNYGLNRNFGTKSRVVEIDLAS